MNGDLWASLRASCVLAGSAFMAGAREGREREAGGAFVILNAAKNLVVPRANQRPRARFFAALRMTALLDGSTTRRGGEWTGLPTCPTRPRGAWAQETPPHPGPLPGGEREITYAADC